MSDLTLTTSASLVGIDGTGQTSSETITSTIAKLDQGITLNNTIDMQNCEWSGSAFACGDSTGAADSFTIKVRILDDDNEELASVGAPTPGKGVGSVGQTIIRHGSEKLKKEFLPKILNADIEFALGYSEPGAGSDLASLRLKAEKKGGGYGLLAKAS